MGFWKLSFAMYLAIMAALWTAHLLDKWFD